MKNNIWRECRYDGKCTNHAELGKYCAEHEHHRIMNNGAIRDAVEDRQMAIYKARDFVIVENGSGTVIAQVEEDCHHKFMAGKVKYDYVKARVFYRATKRWCVTVSRILRTSIIGLAAEDEIKKVIPYHEWVQEQKRLKEIRDARKY